MNQRTSIYDLHVAHKAKMVPFAGYDMPIQYADGVIKEHEWVRSKAGLFDVSHMGQILVEGEGAAEFFGCITPSLFVNTPDGRAKYTVLTNEQGGIIDDLIITKISDGKFFAVINAACKEKDIDWIKQNLPSDVKLSRLDDRSLVAIQGPKAENVLSAVLGTNLGGQGYMTLQNAKFKNDDIFVSRLGYTGEDGFEISIADKLAPDLWQELLLNDEVKEIGLGARDTLRLEMGYPLYGHDIDAATSPIEADLGWVVAKANDNFIGAERVVKEKAEGVAKKRVGIRLIDRGVAREGAEIYDANGKKIGVLTSGGFSPSLKQSIGQGYVDIAAAVYGSEVLVRVRERDIKAKVERLPFVEPKTKAVKR